MAQLESLRVEKLTQSKYFMPDFNAAIYDGPLRIYFAQTHESEAMKIYFHLQQKILEENSVRCNEMAQANQNFYVMLYPRSERFYQVFHKQDLIQCETMGQDVVVGICEQLGEDGYRQITTHLQASLGVD